MSRYRVAPLTYDVCLGWSTHEWIKMTSSEKPPSDSEPPGEPTYIFRPWRRLPDGTVLWAKQFGKKAWRIPVSANDNPGKKAG